MATTNIHSLAYKLTLDDREFRQNANLTQREVRETKRVLGEIANPIEKYEAELTKLNRLREKGAISEREHARAIHQAEMRLRGGGDAAEDATDSFDLMGPAVVAGTIAIMGIAKAWDIGYRAGAAFVKMLDEQFEQLDELAKDSKKLDVLPGSLERLRLQVNLFTSASDRQLSTALRTMVKNVGDAADGTGEARLELAKLGLSAANLNMFNPIQQFEMIRDRISQVSNANERAQLTMAIFGSKADDLAPIMAASSKALKESTANLDGFFNRLDQADLSNIENANDEFTKMKAGINAAKTEIAVGLAPAVQAFAEFLSEKLSTEFARDVFEGMIDGLETMIVHAAAFLEMMQVIFEKTVKVGNMIDSAIKASAALSQGNITAAGAQMARYRIAAMGVEADSPGIRVSMAAVDMRARIAQLRAGGGNEAPNFTQSSMVQMQLMTAKMAVENDKERREEERFNRKEAMAESVKQTRALQEMNRKFDGGRTIVVMESLN